MLGQVQQHNKFQRCNSAPRSKESSDKSSLVFNFIKEVKVDSELKRNKSSIEKIQEELIRKLTSNLAINKPSDGIRKLETLISTLHNNEVGKIGNGIETKYTASAEGRESCKCAIISAYNMAKQNQNLELLFSFLKNGDPCVEGRMQSIGKFIAQQELGIDLDKLDSESMKSREVFSNKSTVNIANFWLEQYLPSGTTAISTTEIKEKFKENKDSFIKFISLNLEAGTNHSILNEYANKNKISSDDTNKIFSHLLTSVKFVDFCNVLKENLLLD